MEGARLCSSRHIGDTTETGVTSRLLMCSYALQVAATSSGSTGSIDIDDIAGRKLSIWDLLRFTLPTLGVWVINPILRCDFSLSDSLGKAAHASQTLCAGVSAVRTHCSSTSISTGILLRTYAFLILRQIIQRWHNAALLAKNVTPLACAVWRGHRASGARF